jgi:hypothetical protein
MHLVDPVDWTEQVGLSGARGAASDVHPADRAFTAEENGATGGVFQVCVVARDQPGHGSDGLVHELLRSLKEA